MCCFPLLLGILSTSTNFSGTSVSSSISAPLSLYVFLFADHLVLSEPVTCLMSAYSMQCSPIDLVSVSTQERNWLLGNDSVVFLEEGMTDPVGVRGNSSNIASPLLILRPLVILFKIIGQTTDVVHFLP